jgi:putative PIN family toxin of toxin-antitoxin system
MRLVLDTNVVASALLWDGAPRRLLRVGSGEDVMLFTSTPLLVELTDILSRPKFEKKISASLLSVDQLVDLYAELVALVRPPRAAPCARSG